MMLKKVFLFATVLLLQAAGTSGLSRGYCAQDKQSDPYLWDFGEIQQGKVVSHDFTLKNDTDDIMEITRIHSSCGCTVSECEKKSLMPHQSTPIRVSFKSKGYSGPVTQFVYVHTDNTDSLIVKFIIKANVVKDKG
ncbi:MAG: DUF1573 domain-containing protein [Candidatus Omnitrophica bacterium]|nr:DUF1573 domain-containing protein [Candidatus Omnitrophota bacterium]